MFDNMNRDELREYSSTVFEGLASDDGVIRKSAADTAQDFIRQWVREKSFAAPILNERTIDRSELDPQVNSLKPIKLLEIEPKSGGAVTVPFGDTPMHTFMGGSRAMVTFSRAYTQMIRVDVMDVITYGYDIRQVFIDHMAKDLMDEKDRKFIAAADAMVGTANAATGDYVDECGSKGYITVGALSRASLVLAGQGLMHTDQKLPPVQMLLNNITRDNWRTLDHDAAGGPIAEDLLWKGISVEDLAGVKVITTIKTGTVPTNIQYVFTEADTLGRSYVLEPPTLWSESKAFMTEMFTYETSGQLIASYAGVSKASYSGSAGSWSV